MFMRAKKLQLDFNILYLLTLSTFFCLFRLGRGSLASWDEALYAVASREIHQSGDWVRLTFFGQPFYDKPPLYFWLTNFCYPFFGVTELSARLPSALCGIGTVWATYFLGSRLFSKDVGFLSAGILLSCADFLHYSRFATLDVTHLFFCTNPK